jgi:hypothetical protein
MKINCFPMWNGTGVPTIPLVTGRFAADSSRMSSLVKFFHEREAEFVNCRKDFRQKSECLVNTVRDAR